MNTQTYLQFITDLKKSIVQSKYQAARLANREQLLLYYKIGMMLSDKVAKEKWGAKVLEHISADLQKLLPGIKGFSFRNLKKMRQFYEIYRNSAIGPSLTAKLKMGENHYDIIGPLPTAQFEPTNAALIEYFFQISFTHHILILNKCKAEGRHRRILHVYLRELPVPDFKLARKIVLDGKEDTALDISVKAVAINNL